MNSEEFNIDIYTNRQLVEGCMEKLYIVIKKTLHSFINAQSEKTSDHQELEELKRNYNKDLLGMLTFFIHNYEAIVDCRLIRSRLFELKQARNELAHNRNFDLIKDVTRIYDTCLYLFDDLGMDPSYETYELFTHIRGMLIIKEAKMIYDERQRHQQQQQHSSNRNNSYRMKEDNNHHQHGNNGGYHFQNGNNGGGHHY